MPTSLSRALLHLTTIALTMLPSAPVLSQTAAAGHWTGSWAASQQVPESQNALPPEDLHDATLRQIVHLSVGGSSVRVHLSNAFGSAPLHLTSVHIARPLSTSSPRIDPATDRTLRFGGAEDVTVPAAAEYISDPIDYRVEPLTDLAITIHFDQPPARETGHPGSRQVSFLIHGDALSAPDLSHAKTFEHWYQISGVDTLSSGSPSPRSIVALGDSITDGHGATTNGNNRWTDDLARRLQAQPSTRAVGVLNQGIGGNHILTDGLGPNALARLDRDVIAQPGARYLIMLEGINDLGALSREVTSTPAQHKALIHNLTSGYAQIVERAHQAGLTVIGATVTPYLGSDYYHPGTQNEADREALNRWIRTPGHFDAVLDFDKTIRDPSEPTRLLPAYDCGDHLHPSPAGYKALADGIPLSLFTR